MKTKLISVLVANLFAATAASAADDTFTWSGTLGIGARGISSDGGTRDGRFGTAGTATTTPFTGPEDKAKANEYRDVKNGGLLGIVDVEGSSNRYYTRFFGENFGRDDQYLNLRGGGYGVFKYQLYQDKMPHNLSWNALTPMAGMGGPLLTAPAGTYPPAQNPAAWTSFDYKLQREKRGGIFELTANSPWHIRADYDEATMKGLRPQSAALGTGSSNGMFEFGAPVDYKTKTFTLEGGYSVKQGGFNVNFLSSKFSNSIDLMQWQNMYMLNGLDTTILPPDNDLKKWSINGALRQLPLNSTLAARFTYSKLTNGFDVDSGGLKPTNSTLSPLVTGQPFAVGTLVTPASSPTFSGEHRTKTGSLSLTSNWTRGVDSRIYWNYYDKKNHSTLVSYALGGLGTTVASCSTAVADWIQTSTSSRFCMGPFPNSLFSFKKIDYGVDLGWRIDSGNKVSGGLNLLDVERHREDAEQTKDRKYWLEYKNTVLEDVSARLKYQNLDRRSHINRAWPPNQNPWGTGVAATSVAYYYVAYDVSNSDQDQIKLVADWTPIPFLDLGFETAWKKTDYQDNLYGRTDDKRTEHNLTVSYGDPGKFRITGLANWENVTFNQAYRNTSGTATVANATGTSGINDSTNFNWGTKNTQTNRLFALIADWPVTGRLALKGSYTWVKTGGGVDFTSSNTAAAGGFNGGPLVNYVTDNTKKRTLNLKGDYTFDKNWSMTLGYVHEKYTYTDDQMRGYQGNYPYFQYLPTATGGGTNNNSWLSGAFANPAYKLNVLYVMGTYRFQ